LSTDGALPQTYLTEVYASLSMHTHRHGLNQVIEGTDFRPGLTDAEVAAVEERYGFRFPPDLRSFLQFALPVGVGWVDWRDDPEQVRQRLGWPLDSMCWDIEHNGFWMRRWGPKPDALADRIRIAQEQAALAPRLIPIYIHRYLPATPNEVGNPVLSVYQTDIIVYGADLADYFQHEFGIPRPSWAKAEPKPIEFWGVIVDHSPDDLEYSGRWPP
jgi:hypothetical protein